MGSAYIRAAFILGFALIGANCSDESRPPVDAGSGEESSQVACNRTLPSCPSTPPSYMNTIGGIVARSCGECHSPGSTLSKVDLSTYAKINADFGSMLTQVYECLMPPPGGASFSPDERTTLLTWLVCGAPDN